MTLSLIKQSIKQEPFYECEDGVLYCADCMDILPQLPEGCVDLCLTDPPYGILGGAKEIGGANIVKPKTYPEMVWDYEPFSEEQLYACRSASINQIIFGYNHFSDIMPKCSGPIVWDKACQNGWNDTFADGEMAWTSFNRPLKIYRLLWKGALRSERNIERVHPTQKPQTLMQWILDDYSEAGQLVLDPFLGSGTTAVACKRLGRKFIGIEISETYAAIARDRIMAESKGLTVKELKQGQKVLF